MSRLFYILILSLLGSIIVHILAILAIPQIFPHKTWERFSHKNFQQHFAILPNTDPLKKTADPFFNLAIYSFDLKKGALKVFTNEKTRYWSLSIYDEKGENFYSVNSTTLPDRILNLTIANPFQLTQRKGKQNASNLNKVILPYTFKRGVILLRVFAPENLDIERNDKFIKTINCQTLS